MHPLFADAAADAALVTEYATIIKWGAGCFGAVLGWYLYFINRHRKDDIKLADFLTVVGVIGGGAVLALFPAGTVLFGAYGVGLAVGFFGYFLVLLILVARSEHFSFDWFLDGRRPKLGAGQIDPLPNDRPMQLPNADGLQDE